MKKIYICSPLRGDIEGNIIKAIIYSKDAVKQGVLPIAPHLLFTRFLDDCIPDERFLGMQMGLELLNLCDEVWIYGDTVTEGMNQEIALAEATGKTVLYKIIERKCYENA